MTVVRKRDFARAGYPRTIETRSIAPDERTTPHMNAKRIRGYGVVFNRHSHNLGGFVESVDPVALNRDRGRAWPGHHSGVVSYYNHDMNRMLGSTRSGSLTLLVDNVGLQYEVVPPSTRADVAELVERGDVAGSSFSFITRADRWTTTANGYPLRVLEDIELLEVGPVNVPAYADTTAAFRSLAVAMKRSPQECRMLALRGELADLLSADAGKYQRELNRKRVAA